MNMSYCAIENTSEDVRQLINLIIEGGDEYIEGLNQYERASIPRLLQGCRELLELLENVDSGN